MLEIHGKRECPFAWRVRLVAREKGAPFEWVPYDVSSPDARAGQHNPERRSPLLWDAGFTLPESIVIAEYLDETCPGRALLPTAARTRAEARLLLATIVPKLEAVPTRGAEEDEGLDEGLECGHHDHVDDRDGCQEGEPELLERIRLLRRRAADRGGNAGRQLHRVQPFLDGRADSSEIRARRRDRHLRGPLAVAAGDRHWRIHLFH